MRKSGEFRAPKLQQPITRGPKGCDSMESRWVWPFELLEKIGEGGMGVVYRARYVGNNRQVAVKLIPEEINSDVTLLARFERELDVLKQLDHPNIVHCFGGRCESKQRFYAMELVPGGTLADYMLERGRLPWESVVDFAIQMCEALQHAHEHGVVHRDIKPGNFLLTKSGSLKLSDFGLASVVSETRLTAAGRTVGTILYMAPEQIRGGTITHKADLYGLGCVIFEMLTAVTPYSGAAAAEVLQRHLKDPIPHVARTILECPLELDQLVCDLLQKDPEDRPATAAEVAERLNATLLPSRRTAVIDPDLFTTRNGNGATRKLAISPLKQIRPTDSETQVPRISAKGTEPSKIPWIISGATLLICVLLWHSWAQSAQRLRVAEQTWVVLLETADEPTRLLAARALAKFDHLSRSTVEKLSGTATSPTADLRIASLKTLTQHPAEARSVRAELMRIQKVDDNPLVRAEAGAALQAVQYAESPFSPANALFWPIVLATLVALGAAGWQLWKKAEQIAR